MGQKPADQTSTNGANGAGDAVDLEVDLDGDNAGTGGNAGGDDDDDEDDDTAGASIGDQIQRAIDAALPRIQQGFQSEMDRRINSALNKTRKGPKGDKDGDEQEQQEDRREPAPAADVRGARLSFREILPDTIKLLGDEERALANEFGIALIRAKAAQGFDDEEEVGREVAAATAKFLRTARDLYSSRTKRILEKSGALVPQGGGQSQSGDEPPSTVAEAYKLAEKKDRELHPERYVGK